jgi:uncharacterized damage-inducible protein DinB
LPTRRNRSAAASTGGGRTRSDLRTTILLPWRTNNRVTIELIDRLPQALWNSAVPGVVPRRTLRAIAAHLHNARCSWIKVLGREHGLSAPPRVDHHRVSRRELIAALKRSGKDMEALFELGFAAGGVLPPSKGYVWRNLALDLGHVLTYFIAHDAHHRGQIVMVARQLGQRLPPVVSNRLWWWSSASTGDRA